MWKLEKALERAFGPLTKEEKVKANVESARLYSVIGAYFGLISLVLMYFGLFRPSDVWYFGGWASLGLLGLLITDTVAFLRHVH
jgi:hypothetical protein